MREKLQSIQILETILTPPCAVMAQPRHDRYVAATPLAVSADPGCSSNCEILHHSMEA